MPNKTLIVLDEDRIIQVQQVSEKTLPLVRAQMLAAGYRVEVIGNNLDQCFTAL